MGLFQRMLVFGIYFGLLIMDIELAVGAETTTANENSKLNETFDDRININHNYALAQAQGKDGSISGSQANSYGYKAGLLYQNGQYRPIASKTGSNANSFTSGRRPPSTYANTGTVLGHQGIKGNADAGYSGGRGNALAGSHSQQIAIPLGFGGPVLLSNLKPLKNQTEAVDIHKSPSFKPHNHDSNENKSPSGSNEFVFN